MSMPVQALVLNTATKREHGRKAQLNNIAAAKAVSDVIRTTLGPRSMLKMILDPMGGIVMTNDGNSILREIDVSHPSAKSMIELSRTQDEEVGDGTTSVIILAGELLNQCKPFLDANMHPRIIVSMFVKAQAVALKKLEEISKPLDITDRKALMALARTCLGTKFVSRFGDLVGNLALDAILRIAVDVDAGVSLSGEKIIRKEIDIKRYARVEKVPGGMLNESKVLDGVMLNKNVTHPKMSKRVENPRIILMDCPLEFKKGESQTNIEITKETDWDIILKMEEEYVERMCSAIIAFKPDLVITEKGVSDLASHYFVKAGVSCIRRVRKTDNNRIAKAVGATIVHEPDEIKEQDVGKGCGLFNIDKIGDEYFTYLVECKDPKACTILLRGGSKDVLSEIERNLHDAMGALRNIVLQPSVVPGGGAAELAIAQAIRDTAKDISGVGQWPYNAIGNALEIIPKTLVENCGASVIKTLTALRAKHANGEHVYGVDGLKGEPADMTTLQDGEGVWDSTAVKSQSIKTAIEAACMLLRIDDIVSGMAARPGEGGGGPANEDEDQTFGDARDG